ncbi:MAG: hypothetical protein K8R44_07345 [Sulfurimonas sp.]|nr:hypothetical protein [Sulfurimonas sp.]
MKLIITFLLSALFLFASDSNHLKVKILENILSEISINEPIKIWSDDVKILTEFKHSSKFKTTTKCGDANIIVLQRKKNLTPKCRRKHIFVLSYDLLSDIDNSFGALFWKKGRPNIIILQPRVKAQSIAVSKNLDPYLEEKIW